MRAADACEELARLVRHWFDQDVAEAFIADVDAFNNAARLLGADRTAENMHTIVGDVAGDVTDRLADWLVLSADSPGAWLYSRIRDYI